MTYKDGAHAERVNVTGSSVYRDAVLIWVNLSVSEPVIEDKVDIIYMYECVTCHRSFSDESAHDAHRIHCNKGVSVKEEPQSDDELDELLSRGISEATSTAINDIENPREMRIHHRIGTDGPHSCRRCGTSFSSMTDLADHVFTHVKDDEKAEREIDRNNLPAGLAMGKRGRPRKVESDSEDAEAAEIIEEPKVQKRKARGEKAPEVITERRHGTRGVKLSIPFLDEIRNKRIKKEITDDAENKTSPVKNQKKKESKDNADTENVKTDQPKRKVRRRKPIMCKSDVSISAKGDNNKVSSVENPSKQESVETNSEDGINFNKEENEIIEKKKGRGRPKKNSLPSAVDNDNEIKLPKKRKNNPKTVKSDEPRKGGRSKKIKEEPKSDNDEIKSSLEALLAESKRLDSELKKERNDSERSKQVNLKDNKKETANLFECILQMTDIDVKNYSSQQKHITAGDINKDTDEQVIQQKLSTEICEEHLRFGFAINIQDSIDQGDILINHDSGHYMCKLCEDSFSQVDDLFKHFQCHLNHFHCIKCGLFYKTEEGVHVHFCEPNESLPQWLQMTYAERIHDALTKEEIIINNGSYKCLMCHTEHTNISLLLRHFGSHRGVYQCEDCSNVYFSSDELSSHCCMTHSDRVSWQSLTHAEQLDDALTENHITVDEDQQKFVCNLCTQSFVELRYLRNHLTLHKGVYTCDSCRNKFSEKDLFDSHVCTGTSNHTSTPPFKCPLCEEKYNIKEKMYIHMKTHAGTENCEHCGCCFITKEIKDAHKCTCDIFKCQLCDKGFAKLTALQKHVKGHTDKYDCQKCGKRYSTKQSLMIHACEAEALTGDSSEKKHFCDFCGAGFTKASYLTRHMASHTSKYRCEPCDKTFARKETLSLHMLKEHPEDEVVNSIFQCEVCKRVFTRALSLQNHMKSHTDQNKCDTCEKCFSSALGLMRHKCDGPPPEREESGLYSCEKCGRKFKEELYLKRHMMVHTDAFECMFCEKRYPRKEEFVRHILNCKASVELKHSGKVDCSLCGKEFTNAEKYRQHYLEHMHPYKCEECQKLFLRRVNLENHNCRPWNGDRVECDQCGKTFKNPNNLKRHVLCHIKARYECEKCHKTFRREDYINSHICVDESGNKVKIKKYKRTGEVLRTEPGISSCVCATCGKSYSSISNMNKHMLTHDEPKEKCHECGKMFHLKINLKQHLRYTHATTLQCVCKKCGKMLKNRNSVYSHMKQFHSGVVETHECQTCHKVFNQKGNLKKHMLVHSTDKKYKCTLCEKNFKFPEQLKRHTYWHMHGCQYQCDYCTREFVMEFQLKAHVNQAHSGTVYRCCYCGTCCSHSTTIKRHLRKQHADENEWESDPQSFFNTLMFDTGDTKITKALQDYEKKHNYEVAGIQGDQQPMFVLPNEPEMPVQPKNTNSIPETKEEQATGISYILSDEQKYLEPKSFLSTGVDKVDQGDVSYPISEQQKHFISNPVNKIEQGDISYVISDEQKHLEPRSLLSNKMETPEQGHISYVISDEQVQKQDGQMMISQEPFNLAGHNFNIVDEGTGEMQAIAAGNNGSFIVAELQGADGSGQTQTVIIQNPSDQMIDTSNLPPEIAEALQTLSAQGALGPSETGTTIINFGDNTPDPQQQQMPMVMSHPGAGEPANDMIVLPLLQDQ